MPLCTLEPLLEQACEENIAVGAFSVSGIEMVMGVLRAAEEARSPVILQIAECRLSRTPLALIGPVMLAAARKAQVPVCVHLDHGLTIPCLTEALELGFTSVMYDGSSLPLAENMARTLEVVHLAQRYCAGVEGEIGRIGRTEDGENSLTVCARPEEAVLFAERTGISALAVGIGNAHGVYTGTPELRYDILDAIREKTGIPLVLHGGTGIDRDGFQACIRHGVRKINIATATFSACRKASEGAGDYFDMSRRMEEAAYSVARQHIAMFRQADTEDGK